MVFVNLITRNVQKPELHKIIIKVEHRGNYNLVKTNHNLCNSNSNVGTLQREYNFIKTLFSNILKITGF